MYGRDDTLRYMAGTVLPLRSVKPVIAQLKTIKPLLKEKYGVVDIGVFGSYARGEETEGSDLDILVELAEPIGWDVVDLKTELETFLGKHVDLVLKGGVVGRKRLFKEISGDIIYA